MTPDVIRAMTPLCLGIIGMTITLAAIFNASKIPKEAFSLSASAGLAAISGAAGAAHAASKGSSVNASQVDEVTINRKNDELS